MPSAWREVWTVGKMAGLFAEFLVEAVAVPDEFAGAALRGWDGGVGHFDLDVLADTGQGVFWHVAEVVFAQLGVLGVLGWPAQVFGQDECAELVGTVPFHRLCLAVVT